MKLKIQTPLPEGLKAVKREPVQAVKRFDELNEPEYIVLGVPYGGHLDGKDADGQFFSVKTDTWLNDEKEIPVTYYHGFGPDDKNEWQDVPAVIGIAKFDHEDDRGVWFKVRLDDSEPLTGRITGVKAEIVKASSGAIGHLARFGDDGEILIWPLGELALFDTNEWRKPANELAVFTAKAEITEADAEAVTQAEAVDEAEPIDLLIPTETNIMEETEKRDNPSVDIDALLSRFASLEAKLDKIADAPAINAPAIIKAENLGDPDPNKAFIHYLRSGERVKGLKANVAPMGESTAAQGGYAVPDDFLGTIVEKRNELSIPRMAGATIIQTNRDVLNIPVEGTSQTYFTRGTEISAVDEDEPGLGQVAVTVYPFTKLVKVSEDLLEDNAANLNAFLANSFGRWWAMTENRCTLIGDGSGDPQGIFVGGTAGLTFDDTNGIAAAEIPELFYKLGQGYRNNASWVLSDTTLAYLRGLSSSSVFTFGPIEIDSGKMMGKPYFTSAYAANYSTTAYKSLCIGDWSMYAMVERKGLTIRRLSELYAGTRQVGILATARFGGAVMQAEAFQYGTQA